MDGRHEDERVHQCREDPRAITSVVQAFRSGGLIHDTAGSEINEHVDGVCDTRSHCRDLGLLELSGMKASIMQRVLKVLRIVDQPDMPDAQLDQCIHARPCHQFVKELPVCAEDLRQLIHSV